MITLTLHDRDATTLLALINITRQAGSTREDAALDRAASALRCALLLCDCGLTRVSEDER